MRFQNSMSSPVSLSRSEEQDVTLNYFSRAMSKKGQRVNL